MADRDETFAVLLRAVNRGVFDRVREVMQERGIPGISMAVLRVVQDRSGLTVSEAARETSIAKSHLSNTVESLAQLGLVEKRPDATDHRLLRIYPTQEAEDFFREMQRAVNQRLGTLLDTLPEADVDSLLRILRTLDRALHKENGQALRESSENPVQSSDEGS